VANCGPQTGQASDRRDNHSPTYSRSVISSPVARTEPDIGPWFALATATGPALPQRACLRGGSADADKTCAACGKHAAPCGHEVQASSSRILGWRGHSVDKLARCVIEPHLRHDLSELSLHADCTAADSEDAVRALAYTIGRDIVFRGEFYGPQTTVGRRLLRTGWRMRKAGRERSRCREL